MKSADKSLSKEIWLGPVLGSNRERLLARCAEYVSNGQSDRLLYIAASHPLLDLVTGRLLDGKTTSGVWGEFPFYLFRGFVGRVLSSALLSEARPSGRARSGKVLSLTVGLLPRALIDREEFPLRRSLISQLIKQLSAAGKLQAIKPLANRDGCVNTIASLIGELQRAGKTAEEFREVVEERAAEFQGRSLKSKVQSPKTQLDFDREVAVIYSAYTDALDRHGLTDEDADQLRTLQILRGEIGDEKVTSPWLDEIDLLVLDGFFDFTPVQGEILKYLIAAVPNVIVNLNGDERNQDIFRPFQLTIEHLQAIVDFEIRFHREAEPVRETLGPLRARLFNSNTQSIEENVNDRQDAGEPQAGMPALQLFECGDREVEIRSIATEIKQLILTNGYGLSDIALVVRERAAYAETILRVCADESIPCNLERRIDAPEVPAVRACGKLFQILKDSNREHIRNPKASDLAHLIKTGYFRPSQEALDELSKVFDREYASLLDRQSKADSSNASQREKLGIGRWRPDDLENVIAYVGSELRANAWIDRALRLIKEFPSSEAAQALVSPADETEDTAATAEDEAPPDDGAVMDRRKKPAPINPAAIAWATLTMKHLQELISGMLEEGEPEDLRRALMLLLERLQFANQINLHARRCDDIPQATLDVRGLESLRRAISAAVRSFDYAAQVVSEARPLGRATHPNLPSLTVGLLTPITLSSFIDEVERSLSSQVLALGAANRDGLRVLEATDVRGLRFRAIFIAGMIEGGFPLRMSRDWLYPHEERVRLQKHGVFLEDISTDTLLKEEHYFYQAACRATERLYLTRPLALDDGSETVASYYIEELRRAIAPAEIRNEQFRADLDSRDLMRASTAAELSTFLVRQSEHPTKIANAKRTLTQTQLRDLLSRASSAGYISGSAVLRVEIERVRNGAWFGPFDGEITQADLRAMLARHFGPEHVYSASGLSTFGKCGFRFFAARVLRLEPRSEAALDLQAIDAGKLLHDILRRFFERHRNQYLPAIDRENLRHELAETADQVFREHEDKVPPLNERIWKIDCEIRKLILDQVLLYELRLQEKTNARGVRPAFFELAFGRASQASDPGSTSDFLKLERPPGDASEVALLQGQIDRVDMNKDAGVAVAYDYKLSQGARLNDIEAGREVQLPIYLAALEQLFLPGFDLGGGGYYRLRAGSNRLNQGLYRESFADCTNVTYAKAKLDDVEWERIRGEVRRRVWDFIDGMRGGLFRVKPSLGKTTCKFCDFSAVCRYDPYRINRKRA